MTSKRRFTLTAVLGCALAAVSQSRLNRPHEDRCHYDGVPIQRSFRVDWSAPTGIEKHGFCCVCCAAEWLENRRPSSGRFLLRDEVDGTGIDPLSAYFVESQEVTQQPTGCRIHVFGNPVDAQAHALQHQGRAVPSPFGSSRGIKQDEKPFEPPHAGE